MTIAITPMFLSQAANEELEDWGVRDGTDEGECKVQGKKICDGTGGVKVGIWQCTPGSFPVVDRPTTETCYFIAGKAEISTTDTDPESKVEVSAGDVIVLPKGWTGRWRVLETIRKPGHYQSQVVREFTGAMESEAKKLKTNDKDAARAATQSQGMWVPARNLVYILSFKDKYLQRMGQSDGVYLWLFPEETVFLVSQGRLHLQDASTGSSMTRQEALARCFKALQAHNVPEIDLSIYCTLAKQRYSVYRSRGRTDADLMQTVQFSPESTPFSFRYDVYKPAANFAKSRRGKPDFVVAACFPLDILSAFGSIVHERMQAMGLDVPVKLALNMDQQVRFIGLLPYDMVQKKEQDSEEKDVKAT